MSSMVIGSTILRVGISPWVKSNHKCYKRCNPGEEIEILDVLAMLINVTLSFKVTDVPGCGSQNENGQWVGLMAMLESNEIDITGNLCDVDLVRANQTFATYSYPVVRTKESYLIKVPEPPSVVPDILGPFEPFIWFTILMITVLFILLKVATDMFVKNVKFLTSLKHCIDGILTITFSMDGPKVTIPWLVWLSFIGCVAVLYSTYIKATLMQPIVPNPFDTNDELAQKLYDGTYKLMDYHAVGRYKCYNVESCEKISQAIVKHGFHYYNQSRNIFQKHEDHALVRELWKNENLVLSKGSYTMKMYLNDFKKRSQLWLIEDESSPPAFMSYYYRYDLPHRKIFDNAIKIIGEFPENLHIRRNGLSKGVVQSNFVKSDVEDKSIKVPDIMSFLRFYIIFNSLSLMVLGVEILLKKFKKL